MEKQSTPERILSVFLVALVILTGVIVLFLRLTPSPDSAPQTPSAVASPTITPYQAAELASQIVSQTYSIPVTDLQVADAARSKDPTTGQPIWVYKFVDSRSQRAYDVVLDDWGREMK